MKDLIIGYETPIGQTIRENLDPITTTYISEKETFKFNTEERFQRVYVCSVSRNRYKYNRDPQYDEFVLTSLFETLKFINCEHMILISTMEVFNHNTVQNENVVRVSNEPFGKNRFQLEEKLRLIFEDKLLIIRIPEIFGLGLEKEDNVLFDLIQKRRINRINRNSSHQWYPMCWLFSDISTALSYNLRVVNLSPDPIETYDIIKYIFPKYFNDEGYYGKRIVHNHKSIHENLYLFSSKSIFTFMINFVRMNEYINSPNNKMSVSNSWDPIYDDFSIFLMKRYGIKNVQIIATKYDTWESIFEKPEFHLKYKKNGIHVNSLQSVFNGINGDFVTKREEISNHLNKVVELCNKLGIESVVIGSGNRSLPDGMDLKTCEDIVSSILESIQSTTDVKICLQPSSKEYGCEIGNIIESCSNMARDKFYINFDTGNYMMETR